MRSGDEIASLASSCKLAQHQPIWETLLIYALESRAAELISAKGTADCNHSELAVNIFEEIRAGVSGKY